MAIICNNCGYDANPDGTEFCEACGSELTITSTTSRSVNNDYTSTPPLPTQVVDISTPQSISSPRATEQTFPPISDPSSNDSMSPLPPMPLGIMGMAKLVAKQSNYPKSEFELSASQAAIVGRFDDTTGPVDVDLVGFPDDDTISRNHAEIYFEGNQWKIKPISTTNGTFIKKVGETRFSGKITGPEVINNGDEIAFAKLRFLFQTF